MAKAKTIQDELEIIANRNGGILRPEDVVEYAKNPKTALNAKFTWDDGVAGHEYRLWQARMIIRVTVTTIKNFGEPCRAYVSMIEDRKNGGGYRTLVSVMSEEESRQKLLTQALNELRVFQKKYKLLRELAPVFAAINEVVEVIEEPQAEGSMELAKAM